MTGRRKKSEIPPRPDAPRTTLGDDAVSAADAAHEQIAHRAYELFLARGGGPGQADADWFQAEREFALEGRGVMVSRTRTRSRP